MITQLKSVYTCGFTHLTRTETMFVLSEECTKLVPLVAISVASLPLVFRVTDPCHILNILL